MLKCCIIKNDNGLENYGKYFARNLLGGIIMFEQKQKIIVVKGEGREKKYAQMLVDRLSKFSDINTSQPMTEREYNKSFVTAESNVKPKTPSGKIIFFGNGKEAKLQSKSVNWQFDRFGMKYGWLGNRCVVTADINELSLEEQSSFADYYNSKVEEVRLLIESWGIKLSKIECSKLEPIDIDDMLDSIRWDDTDDVNDKIAKTIGAVVGSPLLFAALGLKGVGDTLNGAIVVSERINLWEHQYELLVIDFIINGLPRFISNLNEKDTKGKVIIVYDIKDAEYAHLLHNLIQQHSGYDAIEFTEKLFIDNASNLSADNKIIFLGKTKASKERWNDIYQYAYDKNGMRYGWFGNNAFINVNSLKNETERADFINTYNKKRESYADAAKTYVNGYNLNNVKKTAAGLSMFAGIMPITALLGLPVIIASAAAVGIGVGTGVGIAASSANAIADLTGYQYQLLLREFVFNGFEKFMEG